MSKKTEIEQDNIVDKELDRFLSEMKSFDVPKGRSKENAWDNIVSKIEQSESNQKTKTLRLPIRTILSIAASLLILVACWFSYKWLGTTTVIVPNGETAQVELPDQSMVKLNSASSISYKRLNWKNNRYVILDGEAFFEVTKGNSFVVESHGNKVTVLGTGFNIYSRSDRFEVYCFSGKVKVNLRNSDSVVLVKGKAVVSASEKKNCDTLTFNTDQAARWRIGEYYFDHLEINLVFEELERQFNVDIHTPDLGKRYYTGFFRNTNLGEALQNVCLPMGIKYTILDSTNVVIKTE